MLQPGPLELEWLVFVQVTLVTETWGLMNAARGCWEMILARSLLGAVWFQRFAHMLGCDEREAFDTAVAAREMTMVATRAKRTPIIVSSACPSRD